MIAAPRLAQADVHGPEGDADATSADPPPVTDADATVHKSTTISGLSLEGGLFVGYLANPPGLTNFTTPDGFAYRGLDHHTLRANSGAGLIGAELQLGYVTSWPFQFPLLGARIAYPISTGLDRTIGDPGGPVDIHLVNESWGELLLPGVGFHFGNTHWLLMAHAQPALEFYSLTGTLTQQAITVDIGAAGASFGIDADISACAGFSTFGGSKDSGGWVCAYASPLLWRTSSDQQAAFNGMLFGVRVFAVSMP
ncbi:MAG TPA: hypothetical protein VF407_05615 [Polyangiaceae bacterium]